MLHYPGPQFFWWGVAQLMGVENFDVLCITETCKIWAFAAAEKQRYCMQSEAKKRQLCVSRLAGYWGPQFCIASRPRTSFDAALVVLK